MKYLFLLDANYQATNDNDKNMEFDANEVYELSEIIGNKFVNRGAAVAVEDDEIENIDLADALAELEDDDEPIEVDEHGD